jgi:heme exporter protein A
MNKLSATWKKERVRYTDSDPLPNPDFVIETDCLVKKFGFKTVLRKIDLSLRKGDFLALFGPNGAGKTTLLQVLSSQMLPTTGKVYVSGFDTQSDREEIHRRIGVVSHDPYLYNNLSADENLKFYAKMYDVPKQTEEIEELLERVGLSAYKDDAVHTFSRGMQQRLSIARAVIHDPPVLLLDEPFNGLDQQGVDDLKKLLKGFQNQGKTIVMASHHLNLGAELCSHAAVLSYGRIVFMAHQSKINKADFKQTYLKYAGDTLTPKGMFI